MLKFLFGLFTDPLGLPIDAIWEYVILAVVGVIAYNIAWDVSPGGPLGSLIHWVVRLGVFVALWAVTYGVIAVMQWIFANWVLVLCIFVAIIAVACGIIVYLRWRKKKAGDNDEKNERQWN